MGLGPISEYERKTAALLKEVQEIFGLVRAEIETGEDYLVANFSKTSTCTHTFQRGAYTPTMFIGIGKKLEYCYALLQRYHIAIKHRDELDPIERLVLAREILSCEEVLFNVREAAAYYRDLMGLNKRPEKSEDDPAEQARNQFNDLMNKFTNGRWGDGSSSPDSNS